MAELILIRHGETEWSRSGQHTGLTDIPLTAVGEEQARTAGKMIAGRDFGAAYTSPLIRAARTAELAGLPNAVLDPDLVEWDYGGYEGLTSAEIDLVRGQDGWFLWEDGVVPGDSEHPGEAVEHVGERCDRVLARVRPVLRDGEGEDVALVGSGHVLRVLCARWLGLPPSDGRFFKLDTATVSRLGYEHGRAVVVVWNQRPEG
jgi:probable phosphoglycerate mutase